MNAPAPLISSSLQQRGGLVFCILFACVLLTSVTALAQPSGTPRAYVSYRIQEHLHIDGRLDEPAWQQASWTEDFVDIEGTLRPIPRFRTRAKMLWDGDCFYVGAELEEPDVWATIMKRDSVIYRDNDFEIFIDPNGDNHEYFEFEINALNTLWDLFLPIPYRDGGHAVDGWNADGIRTGVQIEGTMNNPSDSDQSWSVEFAIPWRALAAHAHMSTPPRDGDQWRVNFSRVEWQTRKSSGKKLPGIPEDNWVWSPTGMVDMHQPEYWGYVQFSDSSPGTVQFANDVTHPARMFLYRIYRAQMEFHVKSGRWAESLDQLRLGSLEAEERSFHPSISLTTGGYIVTVEVPGDKKPGYRLHLRQDSLIRVDKEQ